MKHRFKCVPVKGTDSYAAYYNTRGVFVRQVSPGLWVGSYYIMGKQIQSEGVFKSRQRAVEVAFWHLGLATCDAGLLELWKVDNG